MKRILSFVCALVLLFTCFPCVAVSADAIKENSKTADDSIVVLEMEDPELFPDLRPDDSKPMALLAPMEDDLPDRLMDYLVEHFAACETSIDVEEFNIPYAQWEELRSVLWYETPELFHLYGLGCSYDSGTGAIVTIGVDYRSFADTAAEYHDCLEKMLDGAAYLLQGIENNDDLSDVEKALLLHDRLAVWTEYDSEGASLMDPLSSIFGAYSALGQGLSVCQGYSMAYMYLLEQAGIESDLCSSTQLCHAWNIVYIDGVAYHVDVTWDDPVNGTYATFNDDYGRVLHDNFLLSSDGIWDSGHKASDYNTAPNDTRYDSKDAITWWRDSHTAIQLIDNQLYYQDNGGIVDSDNGNRIHTHNHYASSLSSADGMLLCATSEDVHAVDPKTGDTFVVYIPERGNIEGMKYEKGKLHIQLTKAYGNSWRESVDYVAPERPEAPDAADYTYTVENGEATITGYTGTGGDVVIPSTLDGYSVTAIGDEVFWGCTSMTSVEIPNTVTAIGDYAFCYCTNLTSVTIPDSVKTIGEYAFAGYLDEETGDFASSLTSVIIGSGVTTIGADAFSACGKLTSVTIPDNVTRIDFGAFCFCYNLNSVTIGKGITAIPDFAFRACDNLTTVTIPASVTAIGENAFSYCTKLTDVYYDGTESQWNAIPTEEGNECLQSANIHFAMQEEVEGAEYTYIVENGEATITGYNGAGGDVVIPSNLGGYPVTAIGVQAFYNCTSLTSIVIPNSVTEIDGYAFYDCIALASVILPESVTVIGISAFDGCTSLKEITIPDSVVTIEAWAFYACENLTDVTMGNGIVSVGEFAFYMCKKLKSISLPDSVTTIGKEAFSNCIALTSVTLGKGVTSIGQEAFSNCHALTSVAFGKELTSIGEDAFWHNYNLTGFWVDEENPSFSNDEFGALYNKDKTVLHQVPCGNYSSRVQAAYIVPEGVTQIKKHAFSACYSLTSVTIPESVRTIEVDAFDECGCLSFVYYSGSSNMWNEINIEHDGVDYGNGYLINAIISYKHTHNYSLIQPVTVDATCTDEGYVEYTCVYGETYREYIRVLGHDYTGDIKTVAPTCTENGISGPTCSRCDEIRPDQETDALGHDMVVVAEKEATCTQPGNSLGTQCSRCEIYGIQPEIYPALDHSFTNYQSNGDATCTDDGTETAKCDRCEEMDTRTEEGSAKGHSHTKEVTNPTCSESGFTTYTCACGDTYTDNETKALGHSYKSGKCTRCSYKPSGAKITTQPVNVAVANGKTAKVTVKATGTGLKYTWYYAKKGSSKFTKTTVTSASYSVKMSSSVDGGKVYCVVTDSYGNSVKSATATLHKGTPAKITTQPKSVTVANGKTGKLELKASGSSLKYQWYVKYKGASAFTKVGSSSKTYSFKMAAKLNGAQAYCVVKDKYGIEVKSSVVTIKMPAQPKITTQPKSVTQVSGKTVKFTVKATGEGLKYQWYYAKKGSSSFKKLSGAKSATYSVKVSSSVNGRKYYCLVTDKYGQTVKSSAVTLTMKTVAKITTQPKSVTVKNGKTAKVTIKAVGDGLKYTWYYLKPGATKYTKASATGASYSVKMAAAWKNAKVYCVISDKYGNTVQSKTATLKMK